MKKTSCKHVVLTLLALAVLTVLIAAFAVVGVLYWVALAVALLLLATGLHMVCAWMTNANDK